VSCVSGDASPVGLAVGLVIVFVVVIIIVVVVVVVVLKRRRSRPSRFLTWMFYFSHLMKLTSNYSDNIGLSRLSFNILVLVLQHFYVTVATKQSYFLSNLDKIERRTVL